MCSRKSELNPGSADPLYKQLFRILSRDVDSFPPGGKFHSERMLCGMFGVSQPVVRTALSLLETEGRIVRVSAKGTFVRGEPPARAAAMKIGVVFPMTYYARHVEAVKGISEVAFENNLEVVLLEDEIPVDICARRKSEQFSRHMDSVDGMIWVSGILGQIASLPPEFMKTAERHAFINLLVEGGLYTSVVADYGSAEYALAGKIISAGCGDLGFIGGPEGRLASRMRYGGFARAMDEAGLRADSRLVIPYSDGFGYMDGYRAAMRMAGAVPAPRVTMAATDYMAAGAAAALRERGYSVPGEAGVAGFDDSEIAVQMEPRLTTVRPPYHELGRVAAGLLLNQLAGRAKAGISCYVPCRLVFRESCGVPPERRAKPEKALAESAAAAV